MIRTKVPILFCLLTLTLSGCALRRYHAAPISPIATASRLKSRNLADPGLQHFLEKNLGHELSPWPPKTWDLSTLTLAGLYFSPVMEMARDQVLVAKAAAVTAGQRPNPTIRATPGIPSPYLFGLTFTVPIETAGKRGYRIENANRLTDAARLNLGTAAWQVRSHVRAALLAHMLARRNLRLLRSQETLLAKQRRLLKERLAVGEIPRPEVDSATIALSNARLAIRTAEGAVSETRAAIAAAIGIPVSGLNGVTFSWPDLDQPPSIASLSVQRIERDAIVNRLDVRRALAQYAAAEASLQLEIAKQYPDIQLGPGYDFEEGNNYFTFALSSVLPIFNHNQGPIAEAEAKRKEAAAAFLALQAQVIAQSETALASYRSALAQLHEAEGSLTTVQIQREKMASRSKTLGESGPLTLNGVRLQGAASAQAQLNALARAQTALGSLEDAVERPLQDGPFVPIYSPPAALPKREIQRGTRR